MNPERIPHAAWSDVAAAGGLGLRIEDVRAPRAKQPPGIVRIGVHRSGPLPEPEALTHFDLLLSADQHAPRPWVGLSPVALDAALQTLHTRTQVNPVATTAVAQVLRIGALLPFEDALLLESFAYSTLLAGAEFAAWRTREPRRPATSSAAQVGYERTDSGLRITLRRTAARNAVNANMRDALCEALEAAALDPDSLPVRVEGEGPDFCAGGDLAEFGSAADPAIAHAIRTLRSPARMIHAIRERVTVRVHGAVVGAGMEMAAAAGAVIAAPCARFWLPELSMGLIPGAGGCASIPHRIGRRRTLYLALTGAALDANTALAWGLVDKIGGVL